MSLATGNSQQLKERDTLYKLIVSQLRYDGYVTAAQSVSHILNYPPTPPSSRLSHLIEIGLRTEGEGNDDAPCDNLHVRGRGIMDLEFEGDEKLSSPEVSQHEMMYISSHRRPSLVAAFSNDGRLAATGSGDSSIKLLDVDKMITNSATGHQESHTYAVLNSLYDHADAVLALDFHPTVSVLASGSNDCTVKFFDYSKPSVKKSYRIITEVASIKTIKFHPSGEYMIVGTAQPTLRLYNINTLQCYVSSDSRDQHLQPVTSVHYSTDGRMYVSASRDGSIKIWDGISNRCVNTFLDAHERAPVSSVMFSKNAKYVLSAGRDSKARLWELSTGRALNIYHPSKVQPLNYGPVATFNHTEDYVLMGEDKGNHQLILCWDSRSTQAFPPLTTGHVGTLQYIAHSPYAPAFITCSIDNRIRFFSHRDNA